jgi:hypothetical protein
VPPARLEDVRLRDDCAEAITAWGWLVILCLVALLALLTGDVATGLVVLGAAIGAWIALGIYDRLRAGRNAR